jgi:erythromycin esterase-like protein
VAFESQIYDFIDLQERYADGRATPEALYDAIGGLWSRAAEIDQLVALLHDRAKSRRLTVSGFDINVNGATALYSRTQLARRLAAALPPDRQGGCFGTIDRLTGWRFDRTNPKNEAFDAAALACAKDIEARSLETSGKDSTQYVLARSFRSFLDMSETSSAALRDKIMYDNLKWNIDRLAPNTKTIVWTATSHSLRSPLSGWSSMASYVPQDMAREMKLLAVVALSGSISGGRQFAPADEGSLEARFAPRDGTRESYIDGDQLRRAGRTRSRVLGYSQHVESTWSEYLDGVVVLSTESPPTNVRPAKPMQAGGSAP